MGVHFIRVHGRVVPIRDHGADAGKKSTGAKKTKDYKSEVSSGKNTYAQSRSKGLSKSQSRSVSNFAGAGMLAGWAGSTVLGAKTLLKAKSKLGIAAGIAGIVAAPVVGALAGGVAATLRSRSFRKKK